MASPHDTRLPESFRAKFAINPATQCWEWFAATGKGYGYYSWQRNMRLAHRIAYQILVGPIPAGLECDHLCRVKHCVNPEHLELVPHSVNVLRGQSPAAKHARQTHCKQGHEFTEGNTYRNKNKRQCRACGRESHRKSWAERHK